MVKLLVLGLGLMESEFETQWIFPPERFLNGRCEGQDI